MPSSWGDDPRTADIPPRLIDATRLWQARCQPTGLWSDIRQFAAFQIDRAPWVDVVTTQEDERIACRVAPLRGGATLVRFQSLESDWTDPLAWPAIASDSQATYAPPPRPRAVAGMAEAAIPPYAPPVPDDR
ncbi:hypothetical protein [Roseicyclus elongatus]|uniref:hypothetical protein n=1 Tax=Roseicyclus elongatus TaxID=159346 RepID=UPI0004B29CFA|nr:hypothetical protein [Roseibacterium elongatum]